eukprot:4177535-Lingulodinium_polyedra.AAC.1
MTVGRDGVQETFGCDGDEAAVHHHRGGQGGGLQRSAAVRGVLDFGVPRRVFVFVVHGGPSVQG